MSNVLIILASPKRNGKSLSSRLANVFLKEYIKRNKTDCVKYANIYEEYFGTYSESVLECIDGADCILNSIDERTIENYERLREQFLWADKYIFAFPNWNLLCPPSLVNYFCAVMKVGVTFSYTPEGSVGLLKNKKALIIMSSGSEYKFSNNQITCYAIEWLKGILAMSGINETLQVVAGGIEEFPDDVLSIENEAEDKLLEFAKFW